MATHKELVDCLYDIIVEGAHTHETQLALGGEAKLPLSGVLADVPHLTYLQLERLLEHVRDTKHLPNVTMRLGWDGDREDGDHVIILSVPKAGA